MLEFNNSKKENAKAVLEEKHIFSGLIFKPAKEKQANLLVDFEQTIAAPTLYSTPLDLPGAIKEIRENNYYFILRDKKLVGTAAYTTREDGSCYISNMAVGPEYRGQGIARTAMQFLLEQCGDSWRIDLITHPENFRSIPLYESCGFIAESRIENFYGDGEPRIIMAKNNNITEGLRILPCLTDIEWQAAKTYRQKCFFDKVSVDDPYTWTFNHKDHQHMVLYNSTTIIGYAHIQLWPKNRAAIRMIVIKKDKQRCGFGKWFVTKIEEKLKKAGCISIHAESNPDALHFYTTLGYTSMPFNDPDGYEGGADDIAVGKKL